MTPNDYVGLTVNVTPHEDDCFHEFQGTIIRVNEYFNVKDQDDNVYDVAFDQLEFV